jgi:UDP:flavonoid glycosyltransferase YjiC (YdhE family)
VKVLFVTWAGGGNSTPVLGLSTRLVQRGHTVKVVSPDDAARRFAAVGIAYERSADVKAAIAAERPDVVVVDFMMPAWLSEAEASGVTWVALVHTLFDRVAAGILTAFTTLEQINVHRVALGLPEVAEPPDLLDAATMLLVTAPRALDTAVPANGVHVGAILEEPGSDAEWRPPPGNDPLIAVCLGTTRGLDDQRVTGEVLDAVADLPVRVVVNAPAHVDTSEFAIAANVVMQGYVRHAAMMPHVTAMVTHAGLGSSSAALSHGIPLVCIPLGRDQHHNADRVATVGAGIALPTDAPAHDIRLAIERVLAEPSFAEAARPFAVEYDPSASAAIDALEAVSRRARGGRS